MFQRKKKCSGGYLLGGFLILTIIFFPEFSKAQSPSANVPSNQPPNDIYRIGPGDLIDVVVARNETLSRNGVRVDSQGNIQLPMLDGGIPAACLTEGELAAQLKERYRKYLLKPSVFVAVKEFNSQLVGLIGAVNSPGRFQLQRSVRLLELLTFVNGPSEKAGRSIQIIRRPGLSRCENKTLVQVEEDKEELILYPLADTLEGKETANPFVQSGDIIRVVDADQAYVIGNVRSAVIINLNETVTLTQAIARAGGVLPDSNVEKIKLIRQTSNSLTKTEQIINLKNINSRSGDDIVLQPNDIVEVMGQSGGKKFLKDLLRTVTTTVIGLPVRVIP